MSFKRSALTIVTVGLSLCAAVNTARGQGALKKAAAPTSQSARSLTTQSARSITTQSARSITTQSARGLTTQSATSQNTDTEKAAAPRAERGLWTGEALEAGPVTSVPYGWVDFCQRYRGECDRAQTRPQNITLTARAQRDIERVNAYVNGRIKSVTDLEHWGVIDRWDYPTDGKGDCEDYVLLKRRTLVQMGYLEQALLLTVVKDRKGDGHAVLTVRTDRGDFILDNLDNKIRDWRQTGYRFVKRQSQRDVNTWVSLGHAATAAVAQ